MAGRRKRKGLRSQKKFEEEFGDLAGESAHELSQAAVQPIHELVGLMKDFMSSQKEREEGLLEEIRNLRGTHRSPSPSARSAVESTSVGSPSPRLALPTPVAPRRPQGESTTLHRPLAEESGQPDFVPPPEWRPYSMEPKIPPYQSGEDIENYLLRFERIARTWKWPEEEWACRLVPLLTGRALEAYSAMDEERAHCYEDLKEALLAKFDISPETYRMQFRSNSLPPGESPTETYHRLRGLYRRWIRPEDHSKEEIGEAIIKEQLLRVFPVEVRTWVKEHEPADGLTAAKLAVQYLNARKGGSAARSINASHRATAPLHSPDVTQLGTNQTGHKASVCPVRKAKVSGACYPPRPESGSLSDSESAVQRYKNVLINGQEVIALLDTGSFMSLIKRSSVPVGSMDYSKTMDVLCVHGDSHPYPTVEVTVTAKDQPYLVTVGVVEHLPVDAILGWDLPVLMDLLTENDTSDKVDSGWKGDCVVDDVSCPVLTRAQAKTGVQPLPDLDSSLCEGGAKGPRKTRRQRRFEKEMYSAKPVDVDSFVWDVPENISVLQCHDETLKCLFAKPLPVISTPFRRIAMDIVGPLVKSSSGHQYILVISDYATRFPEAFPLRTITAPAVLRALIQLFSRVGLPDEILTDQGTNFTSRLMHLFQQQLGITSIKTSPYHPQTDGLVERFNQTLKRMLQKFVDDTGKDWDRWLPFVLFAYREVPQASTGFSPFELLYGWDVQGPLDLLRTQWEGQPPRKTDRNIVQFVLEMRERLSKYSKRQRRTCSRLRKPRKPGMTAKLAVESSCRAWMERSVQAPAKVLFVEKVHEDEDHDELEGGLEGRTDNAAPLLVHLPPDKLHSYSRLSRRCPHYSTPVLEKLQLWSM
ncbi:hypothetical protein WMY93_025137 [Mugilogobius chulae]|uniref:Integrase catalytic domain-containing protein n=1 Tax=Mugilogobius chulae TaxID=88201 RepID=A0AAW0N604_9GOBI